MKWVCTECSKTFEEPKVYTEQHGFDAPPYETYSACPYCGGPYVYAHICCCCDKVIIGPYLKLACGERVCESCYIEYDLGEEE